MSEDKIQESKEQKNDKEINFEKMRKKHERELAEAQGRQRKLEEEMNELRASMNKPKEDEDDDYYDEPYVDDKRLNKKLKKFGEQTQKQTQSEIQRAVQEALNEERRNQWVERNKDFQSVLEHADKFAEENPELAENILKIPNQFERQKLAYHTMKKLGYGQPKEEKNDVQEAVDRNRRAPFYQPSNIGNSPYAVAGNFSKEGKREAYEKMMDLKARMRI